MDRGDVHRVRVHGPARCDLTSIKTKSERAATGRTIDTTNIGARASDLDEVVTAPDLWEQAEEQRQRAVLEEAATIRLRDAESLIAARLPELHRAGRALRAIRDGCLFREGHASFADYLRERGVRVDVADTLIGIADAG